MTIARHCLLATVLAAGVATQAQADSFASSASSAGSASSGSISTSLNGSAWPAQADFPGCQPPQTTRPAAPKSAPQTCRSCRGRQQCEEGLSTGFRFTITALALDAHLALRSLIGQPALLELLTSDNSCRPFHGHLTMVEQSGANGGLARYTLTLAPWTTFLSHNRDSRIFQSKTVREILDAVFTGWQGQGKLTPGWWVDMRWPSTTKSGATGGGGATTICWMMGAGG